MLRDVAVHIQNEQPNAVRYSSLTRRKRRTRSAQTTFDVTGYFVPAAG